MLKISGIYPPELHATNIDVEWVYRRLAPRTARRVGRLVSSMGDAAARALRGGNKAVMRSVFRHYGPDGTLARTWPTGSMVLWVAVLLAASLVLYYL